MIKGPCQYELGNTAMLNWMYNFGPSEEKLVRIEDDEKRDRPPP